MKIAVSVTGIGTTARDRAAALIEQMLAKREAELTAAQTRASSERVNANQAKGGN